MHGTGEVAQLVAEQADLVREARVGVVAVAEVGQQARACGRPVHESVEPVLAKLVAAALVDDQPDPAEPGRLRPDRVHGRPARAHVAVGRGAAIVEHPDPGEPEPLPELLEAVGVRPALVDEQADSAHARALGERVGPVRVLAGLVDGDTHAGPGRHRARTGHVHVAVRVVAGDVHEQQVRVRVRQVGLGPDRDQRQVHASVLQSRVVGGLGQRDRCRRRSGLLLTAELRQLVVLVGGKQPRELGSVGHRPIGADVLGRLDRAIEGDDRVRKRRARVRGLGLDGGRDPVFEARREHPQLAV
jgi:hypothetical protein